MAEAVPQAAQVEHANRDCQLHKPGPQAAGCDAASPEPAASSRLQSLGSITSPPASAHDARNVSPRPIPATPADALAHFSMLTMGHGSGQGPSFSSHAASQQRLADDSGAFDKGNAASSAAGHEPDSDDNGDEDCIFCWFAAPCIVFQPCGHLCCCDACAQPMLKGSVACPMCRGPVVSGINITLL